ISNVCGGDIVAKPFVTRFVHDNEVEFLSPSRSREVHAEVAILVAIAICNRTLVFHAEVRRFYQFVSILIKRVGAKPVLEAFEHSRHVAGELLLCTREIVVEHPIVDGKITLLTLEVFLPRHILADRWNDVVIVDGILHGPGPCLPVAIEFLCLGVSSIGNSYESIGDDDGKVRTIVRFVRLVILARIPHTCAATLAGHTHPWTPERIFRPYPSTIPRRILRGHGRAAELNFNASFRSFLNYID